MISGFEMELGELRRDTSRHPEFVKEARPNTTTLIYSKTIKLLKSEQQAIEQMMNNFFDSYLITTTLAGENVYNDLLILLQKKYHLKHFPYRVECIDISHLSGDWISGGLSCMVGGVLEKKGYRKYKIRSVQGQSDDYASLKEVLERRLLPRDASIKRPNSNIEQHPMTLPNLIILDGGKGQLGIVKKLYNEHQTFRQIFDTMDIIALEKGKARKVSAIGEHIYRFAQHRDITKIPLTYDQVDKLLVKLRDEAHRFSNYYRKQQMKIK